MSRDHFWFFLGDAGIQYRWQLLKSSISLGEKEKNWFEKQMCFFLYNVSALILAHPLLNIINGHKVLPVIDLWLWPNCKTKSDHGVLEIWPKSPKQNAKALAFRTNNHWQSIT